MLMTFFEIMQQKYGREDSFSPDAKTKRNINFIKQLMKILCTGNGSTISPRDERRLSDVVNAVMNDEPQYRVYGITRMLENLPEPATKEA